MADERVNIEIFIESDKAEMSLGDLRKGFASLEEELEKVDRSTKEGQKRFKELSTAMAQTGREIKNVELGFEALDNEQVASELGSVAGAFGDVTAAMVLMGGESEELEAFAARVETAMAISVGFKGAIEGISSGMKLYNNLLKTGKIQTIAYTVAQKAAAIGTKVMGAAMKVFNAIMSLNPLGIIILAIGGAIAAFKAFGGTIKDVIDFALKPYIWIFEQVKKGLQALGLIESDAAKATRKAAKERSEALRESAKVAEETAKRNIEAIKKQTDETVFQIDREIARRKAAGKEIEELEGEKLRVLQQSVEDQIAENEKLIEEQDRVLQEAIANNDYWTAFQSAANKDAAENRIHEQKKELDEAQFNLEIHNIEQQKERDDANKKQAEADRKAREQRAKERLAEQKEREKEFAKISEFNTKMRQANMEASNILAEESKKLMEMQFDGIEAFQVEALSKFEANMAKLKNALTDPEFRAEVAGAFNQNLAAIGELSDAFIKDEDKRNKVRKKLAAAQLAIDTAVAIGQGVRSAAAIPFPGNIPAILSIVATVLGNIAAAKKLLGESSTDSGVLSSSSGVSAAGGGANINPVTNTSTILQQEPTQVYVTETDITQVQSRVSVIENNATIG